MAYVYYKHAEIDRSNPRALAVCDRCGHVYNHTALRFQYDWMGAKLAKLGILVCPSCVDDPQEQLRQIVLPRDPIPVTQPRPEPVTAEMGQLPPVTLDPADVTQQNGLILSNGNLTATVGNILTNPAVLSTQVRCDKRVFKITFAQVSPDVDVDGIGVASNSFQPTSSIFAFLGSNIDSIGLFNDGQWWFNGVSIVAKYPTGFTFTNGCFVLVAVDAVAGLIWAQLNGAGNWNGTFGGVNANPATGVNGVPLGFSGFVKAGATLFNNPPPNTPTIVNVDFVLNGVSLPSGFSAWDDGGQPVPNPDGPPDFPSVENSGSLSTLTNPVPANQASQVTQNALATHPSSYFSVLHP